jgi:hypothetical protein
MTAIIAYAHSAGIAAAAATNELPGNSLFIRLRVLRRPLILCPRRRHR